MEEIADDVAEHYPLPAKNKEWGEVLTLVCMVFARSPPKRIVKTT